MAGGIFISYRRSDSAAFSGRLADFFETHFPDVRVFYDMVAIEPGEDFVDAINQRIASSEVVLAMIGENWLTASDDSGARRLDNPNDFVRLELARALSSGTRVIPVLIDRADMPAATDLPDPLKPLAQCNAQFIRGQAFRRDAEFLGDFIQEFLAKSEKIVQVPPPAPQREVNSRVKTALTDALEDFRNTADFGAFITVSNSEDVCIQVLKESDETGLFNFPGGGLPEEKMEQARRFLNEAVTPDGGFEDGGDFITFTVPLDPAFLSRLTLDIFENVYGELPDVPFDTRVEI